MEGLGLSDRLMADIACIEPVYADGIAGVLNLGANFLTCYFRWHAVQRGGAVMWEKSPAVVVVRPKASLISPHGGFAQLLSASPRVGCGLH